MFGIIAATVILLLWKNKMTHTQGVPLGACWYADDFVILSQNKDYLIHILRYIARYLENRLKLKLHPNKIHLKTLSSGVDFLGWVNFPNHRVLRTVTKRRMFKNLNNNPKKETLQSYKGLMKWGNTYKISKHYEF